MTVTWLQCQGRMCCSQRDRKTRTKGLVGTPAGGRDHGAAPKEDGMGQNYPELLTIAVGRDWIT